MEKSSSFHFDKYFRVATQFVESALWLSLPPHTSIDQLWALGLTSPLTWRGSVATDSTLAHKSTNWELIRSCIRVIIVVVAFCALAAVCRWSQEAGWLSDWHITYNLAGFEWLNENNISVHRNKCANSRRSLHHPCRRLQWRWLGQKKSRYSTLKLCHKSKIDFSCN